MECLQGKQRLHELAPESGLIAAEAVDGLAVQIRQAQKANGDVARRDLRGVGLRVPRRGGSGIAENAFAVTVRTSGPFPLPA